MSDRDDFEHLARALIIAREIAHEMLDAYLDAASGVDIDDVMVGDDDMGEAAGNA